MYETYKKIQKWRGEGGPLRDLETQGTTGGEFPGLLFPSHSQDLELKKLPRQKYQQTQTKTATTTKACSFQSKDQVRSRLRRQNTFRKQPFWFSQTL